MQTFLARVTVFQDSAPGLVKSPAILLKRGRHEATDGVVAASVTPALVDEAAATLGPVVELQVSEENELQGFSSMPPAESFDKRMKVEPVEMAPSAAYLQMPSRCVCVARYHSLKVYSVLLEGRAVLCLLYCSSSFDAPAHRKLTP
jgi:hypothetical protein